ncbi:MAG: GNAT family N-acetyltransferase [Myxococcota bacterium]|nr:GNAT family N-acetyltransferase [Myxococcota bacterium]
MSPVTLAAPTLADVPDIVRLLKGDLELLQLPIDDEALLQTATTLLTSSSFVRLGRVSETDIWSGVIVAHCWTSTKFCGPAFWIETLYVDPTCRRGGVGRELVTKLLEYAEQNGYHGIDLEAYRMNAPAAYLYRSLGFRRLGRERYSVRITDI